MNPQTQALDSAAIQAVAQLAYETKRVEILDTRNIAEPDDVFYTVAPDGKIERHIAERLDKVQIADVEAMINWISSGEGDQEVATVFCHEDGIDYFPKWPDHRARHFVNWRYTDHYLRLIDTINKEIAQADLVRFLRIYLAGAVDSELVNLFRRLVWRMGADSEANLKHGDESWGKAINQKVHGDDALPDEFTVELSKFREHTIKFQIRIAVEILPAAQRFRLIPLADELHRLNQLTLADVANTFAAAGITTHSGRAV